MGADQLEDRRWETDCGLRAEGRLEIGDWRLEIGGGGRKAEESKPEACGTTAGLRPTPLCWQAGGLRHVRRPEAYATNGMALRAKNMGEAI